MNHIDLPPFKIGKGHPLAVICGPCVIESEEDAMHAAEKLASIFQKHSIPFIFKSSYDKANRSSISSYRGPGLEKGLKILSKIRSSLQIPVTSDVHTPEEITAAKEVLDILQIPAFLCRQTDLVVAAGKSGRIVNIKKGQFMAPSDMKNVVKKLEAAGSRQIILTERGASFGYHNLVSDMRSIPIMQEFGYPVCYDASHSVQLPGGEGARSGGESRFIPVLAKSAIAAGANVLFIEAHPNPKEAKSDAASQLSFEALEKLLDVLKPLYHLVQNA
ncbi:MAG: 3-deoxy-8-phosphooctulonate synthase [Simkaniaceae bacterium]